jgi:hypothetical protein
MGRHSSVDVFHPAENQAGLVPAPTAPKRCPCGAGTAPVEMTLPRWRESGNSPKGLFRAPDRVSHDQGRFGSTTARPVVADVAQGPRVTDPVTGQSRVWRAWGPGRRECWVRRPVGPRIDAQR